MNENVIIVQNREIKFVFKTFRRSRRIRILIKQDGSVIVTAPKRYSLNMARQFVADKSAWIFSHLERLEARPQSVKISRAELMALKLKAKRLAESKLSYFNQIYNFRYTNITIRNQKTRWGSCTKKGRLSFNYRVATVPEILADYIFVHELCHLGAFNHSKKFWDLVSKTIPDYKARQKALKIIGIREG